MASNERLGPPWFHAVTAGHLRYLARRGRRPKTLAAYTYAYLDFSKWLELEAIADAEQLTGSRLERWQDDLAGRALPATQAMYTAALRGALRWAAIQEPPLIAPTLWLRLVTPKTRPPLPKPIPRADLDKLLAALAPKPRDLLHLRSRALFLVILSSGARITEALSLDRGQLQDRTAIIIGKGGGQRLLVISEAAEAAVTDYVRARRDSGRALFIDHRHHGASRMTRDGAQDSWRRLCAEVGIRPFTNHRIRHSCATELLRQGVDSLTIAKHLGHRGLQSISGYAEVGLETRREMLQVLDSRIRRAS